MYNNEVRIYGIYSNDNYQLVIGWCLYDSSLHPPKGFVSSLMIAALGPLPCCLGYLRWKRVQVNRSFGG